MNTNFTTKSGTGKTIAKNNSTGKELTKKITKQSKANPMAAARKKPEIRLHYFTDYNPEKSYKCFPVPHIPGIKGKNPAVWGEMILYRNQEDMPMDNEKLVIILQKGGKIYMQLVVCTFIDAATIYKFRFKTLCDNKVFWVPFNQVIQVYKIVAIANNIADPRTYKRLNKS